MTTTTAPTAAAGSAPAGSRKTALDILIADAFDAAGVERLKAIGCHVEIDPELTTDRLPEAIKTIDPDVLVVRSTKVPKEVLDAAHRLSLVVRAGAGYDTIDVTAASARGVAVANCPGMNSTAVAELVMGLVVAADRRIPDQTSDLHRHVWNKKLYSRLGRGLKGRTLGIIGMGQIGRLVARRALAFEMFVLYHDLIPCPELDRHENVKHVGFDEVLANADFVTLHVPAVESTRHLIDAAALAKMQKNAILINTTRGSVVDEKALVHALKTGVIAGAAADVYDNEPAAGDKAIPNELLDLPNVIGTHHVGASTEQAQAMIASETVNIVEHYLQTGEVLHCVNLARVSPAVCQMTVRYLNVSGVLAHVFHVLSDGGINTEEMQNVVYDGAKAACVRIQLDDRPTGGQLDQIRKNANILSLDVKDVSR